MDPTPITPPPWHRALPRIAARLIIVVGVVWLATLFYGWAYARIGALDVADQSSAMWSLLAITAVVYAVLIAIPFIPAIEIAIALLIMNGAPVAPLVYVATVTGLTLAFVVGRAISLDWLHAAFRDLHMVRACQIVQRIQTQTPADRLHNLQSRLPGPLAHALVNYRYLSIAVLLNIPGNVAIGGGGGIMMVAGLSRLFHTGWVIMTLILATAPVPLLVWFAGADVLR